MPPEAPKEARLPHTVAYETWHDLHATPGVLLFVADSYQRADLNATLCITVARTLEKTRLLRHTCHNENIPSFNLLARLSVTPDRLLSNDVLD